MTKLRTLATATLVALLTTLTTLSLAQAFDFEVGYGAGLHAEARGNFGVAETFWLVASARVGTDPHLRAQLLAELDPVTLGPLADR